MHANTTIQQLALSFGFDVVGFTRPQLSDQVSEGLYSFISSNHHGEMTWMQTNIERRSSPSQLWPEAKSVIVVGQNYAPANNPLEKNKNPIIGNISCYAQNEDYHEVLKKKLRQLARNIADSLNTEVKLFVDTAPIMEKPLAQQAGIGWQGKHTCLVSRDYGSWLFLGEILTTLELSPSEPVSDHCGTCTQCIDVCPTRAIIEPHKLDARKCISYLTIEHKGHIDISYRRAIGNRIYGCDDCLAVCPWNKFAQVAHESAYHPRAELEAPLLTFLITLDDSQFRKLFTKSPIKRIGRDRFIRNVLIAIGNSGNFEMIDSVIERLTDHSPLVRAMAVWALAELAEDKKYAKVRDSFIAYEQDNDVLSEWLRRN